MCTNNTDSRTCSEIVANNNRLLQILNILNSFCKPNQKKLSTSWYDAKWQFDGRLRIPSVEQPIQHLFGTPYFSSFVYHTHLYWRQLSPPVVFFFRHSKTSETLMVTSGWVGELLPPICPNQEICFLLPLQWKTNMTCNKYIMNQNFLGKNWDIPQPELHHHSHKRRHLFQRDWMTWPNLLHALETVFLLPEGKYFIPKIENPKINITAVLQPTEPTSSFASKSGGNHVGREFKIPA